MKPRMQGPYENGVADGAVRIGIIRIGKKPPCSTKPWGTSGPKSGK